jgi:hypothetical protein
MGLSSSKPAGGQPGQVGAQPYRPTPTIGQPNSFGQTPTPDLQDRWHNMNPFMKMMFAHAAAKRGIMPMQSLQNAIWFNQRPPAG